MLKIKQKANEQRAEWEKQKANCKIQVTEIQVGGRLAGWKVARLALPSFTDCTY